MAKVTFQPGLNMTEPALLLSDRDVASLLGVSRASIWRRVADGTLPRPIKIGSATRWRRDELLAALDGETAVQRLGRGA